MSTELVALPDLLLQCALERGGIAEFIVKSTARELCDASREIGDIRMHMWSAIAERLAENGARVDQLTVGELRCLARDEMESRREAHELHRAIELRLQLAGVV